MGSEPANAAARRDVEARLLAAVAAVSCQPRIGGLAR
jgi:hypothetical protein